jgi:hypothetical protein
MVQYTRRSWLVGALVSLALLLAACGQPLNQSTLTPERLNVATFGAQVDPVGGVLIQQPGMELKDLTAVERPAAPVLRNVTIVDRGELDTLAPATTERETMTQTQAQQESQLYAGHHCSMP